MECQYVIFSVLSHKHDGECTSVYIPVNHLLPSGMVGGMQMQQVFISVALSIISYFKAIL